MKPGPIRPPRRVGAVILVFVLTAGLQASATRARVALRWEPVAGATAYDLQIAKDKKFTDLVLRERVSVAGYRWSELPSIIYYWRVRSIDKEGREGPWSTARTISPEVEPPKLAGPGRPVKLPCVPSCSLQVAFEPQQVIATYVLEVSTTPDFAQPQRVTTTTSPARAELPGPGVYHYRLSGIDVAGRKTGASEARIATAIAPPPSPAAPGNGAVLPFDPAVPTAFSWTAPDGYRRFELEWRRGEEKPLGAPANGRATVQQLANAGVWSWRLRAVLDTGARTEWTAWTLFVVAPGAPQLVGPQDGASFKTRQPSVKVPLVWKGAAAEFILQRAANADFSEMTETPAPCCTLEQDFPPGKTHWRVVPKDAHGNAGAASEARWFEVSVSPPLEAPTVAFPEEAASVPPGNVELVWADVPGAVTYEVAVQAPAGGSTATTSTRAGAAVSLPADGEYRVRIRALDADGIAGAFGAARAFFVGPPPTVRVERVGPWPTELLPGQEAELQVALVDARGRRVTGAAPEVTYADATLTPAEGADASWRVKVRAPDSNRARSEVQLQIQDRGFVATEAIPVSPAGGPIRVTGQLGVANGFGTVFAPYAGVDAWMPIKAMDRRVALGLRGGVFGTSVELPASLGASPAPLSYQVMPVALTASWLQRVSRFELRGGAGGGVSAFWAETPDEANGGIAPYGLLFASAGTRLGPGVLSLDASVGFGRGDQPFAKLRTGAAIFAVSYGMDP